MAAAPSLARRLFSALLSIMIDAFKSSTLTLQLMGDSYRHLLGAGGNSTSHGSDPQEIPFFF